MDRPVIGITIGDPSGIGPEIVLKALRNDSLYESCRPLVIGSGEILRYIGRVLALRPELHPVENPRDGLYRPGSIDIFPLDNLDPARLRHGEVQAESGRAAFEYIGKSVELAASGAVSALATAPINKESIRAAGIDFIGHTEMLAALTGTRDPLTLFQVRNLRVFFLTRHVSLRQACDLVREDRVAACIRQCHRALQRLGIRDPRLAVAGLNPHGGEHGLFGEEEMREIEPAVASCRREGLDVTGPVAADAVFHQALRGRYDAVLSLYHDQGHIATKMVDFERTVSVTLGLPFLRTSVDHGTAFDIAGKGLASSVSMEEAVRLAAEYARPFSRPARERR